MMPTKLRYEVEPQLTCSNCGYVYPGMRTIITGPPSSQMSGISHGLPCPRCGQMNMTDSTSFVINEKGLLEIITDAQLTANKLQQLKQVVEATATGATSIDEFKAAVNNIAPSLGDRFEAFCKDRQFTLAFLSMLAAVLATIVGVTAAFKPDAASVTNNSYFMTPSPVAARQKSALNKLQSQPYKQVKGSNYTPPKKHKRKR